jgi:hypothetical protein
MAISESIACDQGAEVDSAQGAGTRRPRKILVRQLQESDSEAAVTLLTRGFWDRTPDYWRRALARLRDRQLPGPYPRFGYALVDSDELVGVLLLIFSRSDDGNIRANVSSWYVEPDYRLYSNMMLAPALSRFPEATFINVSPSPHTLQTIGVQAFEAHVKGTFVSLAALAVPRPSARISECAANAGEDATMLETHAALGCLSLEVTYRGAVHPFIFLPRLAHRSGVKFAQLIYCKSMEDFVLLAGPLGRWLLKKGFLFVILDANEPVKGLFGRYFAGRKVKVFRGPVRPRLGDLTHTELVLFGP